MVPADVVFAGGSVFTADGPRSRATAVAVEGERIIAVGHDEVRELIGPRTEVVDLAGRLLLPGFTDSHVHPVWAGLDMLRCDLTGLRTREEYLTAIGAYASANPRLDWVRGGGWSMEAFPGGTPTASDLDSVVADRPAFFPNRDGHGAWVNSSALRVAGIDRETPDPPDGRIERDEKGEPTGTLHEGAMALTTRFIPENTIEELTDGLLLAQEHLHALGLVGWQDAIVGPYGDRGDPAGAYLSTASAGRLTARVVGSIWWDRSRGLEQLPELLERRERYRAGRFSASTVKIMQDGVAENFTAAMNDPYLDACGHPSENSGISFVPPEVLADAVAALDAEDFQVHFHAIGDRAVRQCLDAVAASIARNGRSDNRHHLAHLQVVHPDDVARFRALGVIVNMQSLWAALEPQMVELTIPFLGGRRAGWQYPFGDLMRAGATLAAGSDWSVSSADPWEAIHVAVNRTAPDAPDTEPFLPEQRLDLATSLSAYTAGSAWLNHRDDGGVIAPGNLADLVVVDRDPFTAPVEEIAATRVLQTFVGGERVFAADDA